MISLSAPWSIDVNSLLQIFYYNKLFYCSLCSVPFEDDLGLNVSDIPTLTLCPGLGGIPSVMIAYISHI